MERGDWEAGQTWTPGPETEPRSEGAIGEFDYALKCLAKAVEELEIRVTPVMRSGVESDTVRAEPSPGTQLRTKINQLNGLTDRLTHVTERIDL